MLIKSKEHLTKAGILELVAIKASLNLGLSESLKAAFQALSELLSHSLNLQWFKILIG